MLTGSRFARCIRPLSVFLLVVAIAGCGSDDPLSHLDKARVARVIDGDTIVLEDGRTVRYIGIDTPEIGDPGADSATLYNERILRGGEVRLEYGRERQDRYGRTLAWVFADGRMVNLEILKQGWAWCFFYPDNMKYADQMVLAVRVAVDSARGLWRMPDTDSPTGYIASFNSFRFHRFSCESASQIRPRNRVIFPVRDSAIYAGYAPCRNCKP